MVSLLLPALIFAVNLQANSKEQSTVKISSSNSDRSLPLQSQDKPGKALLEPSHYLESVQKSDFSHSYHYIENEPEVIVPRELTLQSMYDHIIRTQFSSPRKTIRFVEQFVDSLKNQSLPLYWKIQRIKFFLHLKIDDFGGAKKIADTASVALNRHELEPIWPVIFQAQLDFFAYKQAPFVRNVAPYLNHLSDRDVKLWYLYTLGVYKLRNDQFDEAIHQLLLALTLTEKSEQSALGLAIKDQLARIFFYTQQYQKALEMSEQIQRQGKGLNDRFVEVTAYANLMNIYYVMAIKSVRSTKISEHMSNFPDAYYENLKKAEEMGQIVLRMSEHIGAHRSRTRALIVKQNLLLSQEKFLEMLEVAEQTVAYAESHQLNYERAVSFNNMSIAYRGLKSFDRSLAALQEAEAFYVETRQMQSVVWVLEDYSNLYQAKGDFAKALELYKQYHLASQELISTSNNDALFELQEKFSAQQKADEIVRLNQQALLDAEQLNNERLGRWLLVVILVAVTLIVLVLLNKRKRLHHLLRNQSDLNEQISQISAAKQRFFINISHEFRTALTLSIGSLKPLLSKSDCQQHEVTTMINNALSNNMHMLSLINEVMDIERMQVGTHPVTLSCFSLKEVIATCLRRFSGECTKKSITVKLKGLDNEVLVYFDYPALEKIFANLISNAIKFSCQESQIDIDLLVESKVLIVRIRDRGCGIDAQELPFLFRRFFQGKNSLQQSMPGTGIGLSMVKELAEINGAKVTINNHPNGGCSAEITLKRDYQHYSREVIKNFLSRKNVPLTDSCPFDTGELVESKKGYALNLDADHFHQAEASDSEPPESLSTPLDHAARPSLLIVDDNPSIRQLLRSLLQPEYHIAEAENGVQALPLARRLQPDLILSDVMMPEMDGFSLVQALREDRQLAHISIILLTALGDKQHTFEGLNKGADDYISKPFDELDLKIRVKNLLKRKRELSAAILAQFKQNRTLQSGVIWPDSQVSRRHQKLEKLISEQIDQSDFDVEQMYTALNMTRSTLFRYVKQHYDCSPKALLKQRRLEFAHEMLTLSDSSVSEVAYAVGFQSLSTFSRAFREHYDVPPTQIKKREIKKSSQTAQLA